MDSKWKRYSEYKLAVDPEQDDKATQVKLCGIARPHMRAFHFAWFGFFTAFFVWFSIAPLLSEIKDTLGLSKKQIWTSNITSVAGTIVMRFILGPLCDKYGARVLFTIILITASIPTGMVGLINSATSLAIFRLFIGVAGGAFVPCQYWTTQMFSKEIVGTANAFAGGWGNLGGGATILIMGSALFPLFKKFFGGDSEKAWRTVTLVPAILTNFLAVIIYKYSDDSPKGNYKELEEHGVAKRIKAKTSFKRGATQVNTWLLFLQYGCCFGVELTMNNAAALYFKDEFGQTTESAAAIASIFGWMNLFARPLGGILSDKLNARFGMRGRLWTQTILLSLEGVMVLIFANANSLAGSIVTLVFFSIFVQAAEGSTYGIVPYVDPPATGSIAGIVGAGGNTGAVLFSLLFRELEYKTAFTIMGFTIIVSAILCAFIKINNYAGLLWGADTLVKSKSDVMETTAGGACRHCGRGATPDPEVTMKVELAGRSRSSFGGSFSRTTHL